MTHQTNRAEPPVRFGAFAIVVSAALAALTLVAPASAQPAPAPAVPAPAASEDGGAIWAMGACANCHGNLAAGDGDPAYPIGPNLRTTRLTPEELVETISCGRPGTEMPYNLAGAYTEHACYGMAVPTDPVAISVSRGADLTAEQIQVLVDFLVENVVGENRITRENCAVFFGGNADAPACRAY